MTHPPRPRQRLDLAAAVVSVVALGLLSRAFPALLPAALGKYPGDALWALMIYFGIAFFRPDLRPPRLAVSALGISCLVEFSQLYQAPWIDSLRANRLGHLVLGSRFHWPDLVAYALGVFAGLLLDVALFLRRAPAAKTRTDEPFASKKS